MCPSLSGHPAVPVLIPHEALHLGGEPGALVAAGWLLWLTEPVLCSSHLSHRAVSALASVLRLGESDSPGVQDRASTGCQSLGPGHSWPICAAWPGQGWLSLAHFPRLEGQGWTQPPFLLLLGCGTALVSNNSINTGTLARGCGGGQSKVKKYRECLSGPTFPFPA